MDKDNLLFIGLFFMIICIVFGMGILGEYVSDGIIAGLFLIASIPISLFAFFGILVLYFIKVKEPEYDREIERQMRNERESKNKTF
ncbi:MAG: hypothetical protein ISR81_08280 [Nitrosopumilus sp.]|nr:hypothetical protein [Nitrosopumilus sp.]